MCGIAGIVYRDPEHYPRLGRDLLALVQPLESRGPDSCGVALYSEPIAERSVKLILMAETAVAWQEVQHWLSHQAQVASFEAIGNGQRVVLRLDHQHVVSLSELKANLQQRFAGLHLLSTGQQLEIYKSVGAMQELVQTYGLQAFAGSHGIGHTRMATESVVDTYHSHPFSAAEDLAIVHNGQIANYYRLRARLERLGFGFETDNDSEVIAHCLRYQLLQGHSLATALEKLCHELDGTYTFLAATQDQLALVRDPMAAKPAVIYESPSYIAIASEYRALLNLPSFEPSATIREPDAGEINLWPVSTAAPARLRKPSAVSV